MKRQTSERKYSKDKNYRKVKARYHYTGKYRGAADSICNLKYNTPKEISVVFQNESNYDYHYKKK